MGGESQRWSLVDLSTNLRMILNFPVQIGVFAVCRTRWWSLGRCVGIAVATALAIALVGQQVASAQSIQVSDCFNGALAGDPVHCTVIQDAHNQGTITVEAIYSAGNGRLLYVYVAEDQSDADRVFEDLAARAVDRIEEFGIDSHCSTQFAPRNLPARHVPRQTRLHLDAPVGSVPGRAVALRRRRCATVASWLGLHLRRSGRMVRIGMPRPM